MAHYSCAITSKNNCRTNDLFSSSVYSSCRRVHLANALWRCDAFHGRLFQASTELPLLRLAGGFQLLPDEMPLHSWSRYGLIQINIFIIFYGLFLAPSVSCFRTRTIIVMRLFCFWIMNNIRILILTKIFSPPSNFKILRSVLLKHV